MRRLAPPLILLAAVSLAGCKPEAPRPPAGGQSALDIMEKVAVGANNCWFKSGDPSFKAYSLAPELTSFSGRPRILLVRKGSADIRPLLVVQAEGRPARLDAFGPLMNESLALRIQKDVVRWANGAKDC
jgi:hypothetical protein